MPGRQAKVLSKEDLQDLLVYASATRNPIRNRVIVLLSAKAGLRAGEIANLTWDMVLAPNGAISTAIELRDHAAKKRSGRLIPLHKDLRNALASLAATAIAKAISQYFYSSTPVPDIRKSEGRHCTKLARNRITKHRQRTRKRAGSGNINRANPA